MSGLSFFDGIFASRRLVLLEDLKGVLSYASGILKKDRFSLAMASFLKLLSFPLGISIVYITKETLDKGIMSKDLRSFGFFTALGLFVFLLMRVLLYFSGRIMNSVKTKFSLAVDHDLARRLFGLDYLKIRQLSSAENAFYVSYDCGIIENLVFYELPALLSFVKIPVFFILAALLSWQLSLFVFLAVPFAVMHTIWASRKRRRLRSGYVKSAGKSNALFSDFLINVKLIKSFFKESWAVDRIMRRFRRKARIDLLSSRFRQVERFVYDIFSKSSTAAFWLLGGYLIITGKLSLGSFSAVSMYSAMLLSEVYNLGSIVRNLNEEGPSIHRSAQFIRDITGPAEDVPAVPVSGKSFFGGDIEFRDIAFGYSKEKPLFQGLNMLAPARKWTLIKGPSGVGKTTLLSLMIRLFRSWRGGIYIGGTNIFDVDIGRFSGYVSCVHQESYIFNDTIFNNVLLGDKKPGGLVREVMRLTRLDELADDLSIGYNTKIGELGATLSGGQKQRVAIARALIREPKVLILDEATSFLDARMESDILSDIKEQFSGLTVLYVTHRETADRFADVIFELKEERVGYGREMSCKKS